MINIKNTLFMKLLIVFMLLTSYISSQVSSTYAYSVTTGSYTANSTPTTIHSTAVDEALSAAINIGFSFTYDNVAYTQFKASTNGFITLDMTNTSAQPSNDLKSSTERLIIAPLWDNNKTGSSGNVNYKLTGSTPNQVLTVEWKALRWNKSGFSAGTIDCQVKLYESTNVIEFIYNRGTYQSFTNSIGIGASIGIGGSSVNDFIALSDIGSNATASTVTEITTIGKTPYDLQSTHGTQAEANAYIPNGLTYTFSIATALPIELLSFDAIWKNEKLNFYWVTASETNLDRFDLEYTLDGKKFNKVGSVYVFGNSSETKYYNFNTRIYEDNIIIYARLKEIDIDGKEVTFDMVSVVIPSRYKSVKAIYDILGNPATLETKGMIIILYTDGSIQKMINY